MPPSLSHLIEILLDENQPLPLMRTGELSDLNSADSQSIRTSWVRIPLPKRRQLLKEMGRLAEDQIELNFQAVYLLAMDDPDSLVRQKAITNTWESEDPILIPPILECLRNDPDQEVRAVAAGALGRFVYLGEVSGLPGAFRTEIEDALLHAISGDPAEEVRLKSLESLGFSSREEVPTHIEGVFLSGSPEQVRSALLAMGRSADNRWNSQVLSQLQSPEPALRYQAAIAAGELAIREAVEDLIDLTEDVDEKVRKEAIWALAQTGGNRASAALDELYSKVREDDERQLLQEAIDLLQFTEDTRSLFHLEYDLSDEENQN